MAKHKLRLDPKSWILLGSLTVICLLVTPWHNFDAVNPPKLASLLLFSAVASLVLIKHYKRLIYSPNLRLFVWLSLILIVWIGISLSTNSYSFGERLFGVYGRNLGYLTYTSLCVLMLMSLLLREYPAKVLNSTLLIIATGVSFYYLIQYIDLDPAEWNIIYEQSPSSTLGNPNFVSALVAMGAAVALGGVIESLKKRSIATAPFTLLFLGLLAVVLRTTSTQGLLIIIFAVIFYLATWLIYDLLPQKTMASRRILIWFLFAFSTGGLLVVFATLRDEILQGVLNARLDYWVAGLKMISNNPIFGVGFDSYGDYYLRSKPEGAQFFSDSAHNLWIEIAAYAGLPALVLYLTIQGIVLRNATKALRIHEKPELRVTLLAWFGFHIQSLVSPSSIALLTIGFVLSGFLYGQTAHLTSQVGNINKSPSQNPNTESKFYEKIGRTLFVSLCGTLLIALPFLAFIPLVKDSRFRDAIESGDGAGMINQARAWPFNSQVALITANTLSENNYKSLAVSTLETAVQVNPENSALWSALLALKDDNYSKATISEKLRNLDPQNPLYQR